MQYNAFSKGLVTSLLFSMQLFTSYANGLTQYPSLFHKEGSFVPPYTYGQGAIDIYKNSHHRAPDRYDESEIERSLMGLSAVEMEGGTETTKKEELASKINEYVDFGGAIEIEPFAYRDFENKWRSDIVLEAAEIDFEITLVDWAKGFISFEWEHYHEAVIVKEAFVTLGDTKCCPYFLLAGRVFVPFGVGTGAVVGDTLSVTDPLTIELFETRETVLMVGTRWNNFFGGFYAFNGDTHRKWHHNHIDQYGATIRYAYEGRHRSFHCGFDMISCVFDSDALAEEFHEALHDGYAPGLALHCRYFMNGFSFIAEFNGTFTSTSFVQDDISYDLAPKAWQIEVGYERELCCRSTYVALNYSRSYDLQGTFPKSRLLLTLGRWIYDDILLAIEYGRDVDYSTSNLGTGNSADLIIGQLAYEW